MLELASMGAQVLHNRSVEMAKRYCVDLEVLSSYQRVPGTKVKEVTNMEQTKISGIAKDNDTVSIGIVGLKDEPGIAFKLFRVLAAKKINVDIILQSAAKDSSQDISFTISKNDTEACVNALEEYKSVLGFSKIIVNTKVSKISIVGAGMMSASGIAALMFEALYDAKVNISMISTSEIKISVIVDEQYADRAVQSIHNKFFGD